MKLVVTYELLAVATAAYQNGSECCSGHYVCTAAMRVALRAVFERLDDAVTHASP